MKHTGALLLLAIALGLVVLDRQARPVPVLFVRDTGCGCQR